MSLDRAILASGCFWGAQELLRKQPGVIFPTEYPGGSRPDATYRAFTPGGPGCQHRTGE